MSLGDYARATANNVKNKIKQKLLPILLKFILPVVAIVFLMIVLVGIIIGLLGADTASAGEGYNSMEGIVGNTVEEKVWFSLKNIGISEYAVAGVMGNIEGESSFDPNCVESNGEGIGLCQWSFGRKTQLQKYATSKGVEWSDVDTQIEFLIGEITKGGGANGYASFQMSGTHYGYTYDTWYKATDTDTATEAFMAVFERPDMTVAHTDRRKKSAKEYYEKYKGKVYYNYGDATNNADIKRIQNKYKQDSTWTGGGQCFGFVNAVTKEYYGTECDVWDFKNGTNTHTKVGKGWTKSDDIKALDNLKPGDSLRWHRSKTNNVGHSAWVIKVDGDTITIAEANYSGINQIDWTRTVTKTQIKQDHFDYVCIAPYAIGAK